MARPRLAQCTSGRALRLSNRRHARRHAARRSRRGTGVTRAPSGGGRSAPDVYACIAAAQPRSGGVAQGVQRHVAQPGIDEGVLVPRARDGAAVDRPAFAGRASAPTVALAHADRRGERPRPRSRSGVCSRRRAIWSPSSSTNGRGCHDCCHGAAGPRSRPQEREGPPMRGPSACAEEDSNLHGPFGPQGPQPSLRAAACSVRPIICRMVPTRELVGPVRKRRLLSRLLPLTALSRPIVAHCGHRCPLAVGRAAARMRRRIKPLTGPGTPYVRVRMQEGDAVALAAASGRPQAGARRCACAPVRRRPLGGGAGGLRETLRSAAVRRARGRATSRRTRAEH
jgi:hypothetical protein